MNPEVKSDTIAAIATPPGVGGIGIIRISGPESLRVVSRIFRRGPVSAFNPPGDKPTTASDSLQSWRLHYGHIFDSANQRVLDEVLLAIMPSPNSYTREDVVEIQAHGGSVVLWQILNLILDSDCIRLAEPGEFTKRAFLNGRIDLTEAEAVMDMISANSEAAVEIAMTHIAGRFGDSIKSIIETLHNLRILIEAEIDFPDSMDEAFDLERAASELKTAALDPVARLIEQHHDANFFREGLAVVIAGGPNVGKSSLMNQLLQKNRTIVSDIPGTTRDFIEASFVSKGIPIILTDTAGFRTTHADPIERLGIEGANQVIENADIVLFVVDVSKPFDPDEALLFERLQKIEKKRIVVMNKFDTTGSEHNFKNHPLRSDLFLVKTSCIENMGIDDLKNMIADLVILVNANAKDRVVPNLRQRIVLEDAARYLSEAVSTLAESGGLETVSIDIQMAENALREIVGDLLRPDILDSVFDRFCVGK